MSRRSHSQSGLYPADPIILIFVVMIILMIFFAWFLCRCGAVSYYTMKRHPHNRLLNTSFVLLLLLCTFGLIISLLMHNAAFASLGTTGFLIHAAIAKKVQVQKSPLFISSQTNIRQRVLKTSWWADHPA
jgi:hypothetical protein